MVAVAQRSGDTPREPLLWALSAATFLIFFLKLCSTAHISGGIAKVRSAQAGP
jgi:hypothetical protein